MDPIKLGSGDNCIDEPVRSPRSYGDRECIETSGCMQETNAPVLESKVSAETIVLHSNEGHESKLKDRIAQCRNIIESLKLELREEKSKIEKEIKNREYTSPLTSSPPPPIVQTATKDLLNYSKGGSSGCSSDDFLGEFALTPNMFSASVENKLNCDENLMEYEKQLEQYQTTLNMAQIEKKNAIRKQMLTKAYRLKLLELENQCNIELLRVKQSLQCLEPLQMIASNWKTEDENEFDLDKYELLPRFPEPLVTSSSLPVEFEIDRENSFDQIVGTEDKKV